MGPSVIIIYLFIMKSYMSTQKNTKKNKNKTNEQRIELRHT